MPQILLLLVGVLLAVAAADTLYREYAPFSASARERIEDSQDLSLAFGPSSYSQDLALDECLEALTNPIGRLDPVHVRQSRGEICIRTAATIRARSPMHAYAAFVSAYAGALRGEAGAAGADLRHSRRLAPNEGWLAQLRLRLAREGLLPIEAMRDQVSGDIRTLGMARPGLTWLADWYRQRPEAQEIIRAAIETLPQDCQRRFLAAVRDAAA